MSESEKFKKWLWIANYCRMKRWNPAISTLYNKAEEAFEIISEYKKLQKYTTWRDLDIGEEIKEKDRILTRELKWSYFSKEDFLNGRKIFVDKNTLLVQRKIKL